MRLNAQTIKEALELMGPNGEGWARGFYARDSYGVLANYTSSEACKFCIMGSIHRAYYNKGIRTSEFDMDYQPVRQAIYDLGKSYRHDAFIVEFNDEVANDFEDIRRVMLEAIKIAELEEERLKAEGYTSD